MQTKINILLTIFIRPFLFMLFYRHQMIIFMINNAMHVKHIKWLDVHYNILCTYHHLHHMNTYSTNHPQLKQYTRIKCME